MKKCSLKCPVCAENFQHRVSRSWFLRYILFFINVKIYFCNRCKKRVYVLLTDQEVLDHRPVW